MSEKPLGIKILSALHLLGGILLAFNTIVNAMRFRELEAKLHGTPILAIMLLAYLAVLALSSGIGMWQGRQWGWWLAAFFYVHGIVRFGSYFQKIPAMAEQIKLSGAGIRYLYTIAGLKILASAAILIYLLSPRVWATFGLGKVKRLIVVAGLFGIALLVGAF